jgi:ferredoxin
MTQDIYQELQKHLDDMPVGFPTTKSGVEMRLLKYLFTPKEAYIAINLQLDYEPVKIIHSRLDEPKISIEDLEKALDIMVSKGLLNFKKEKGIKLYGNALLVIGIYEYQVNRLTRDFLEDLSQYSKEGFGLELFGTKISQFRTVPVEKSVTPDHYISNYDEIKAIIENAELPISLAQCVCRKGRPLRDRKCNTTDRLETCIGFGHISQMYIDQGWAREISREEAFEVMRKNQIDGLIPQVSNEINPYFICNCCSCCCGALSDISKFPRPSQFIHTNFYSEVDIDLCMGCETCIDRCPMTAIKIIKGYAKINRKKCIGCGNCVPICPEGAISLIPKEEKYIPPKDLDELFDKIKAKKLELRSKKE